MLSISSTKLITAGPSTSGTICGTSPWKEGIRSSSRTSRPPIDPFLVFFWKLGRWSERRNKKCSMIFCNAEED
ncbi:hypothetical protein F383_26019 [Gossypium arboreum]|uniref:Uncharacterized protein n=1 Tax=Gossypium arboreum TaxID=29729 RepID=A0A0B0P1D0_GOSAR|nr:hypothetical protein F383_18000 [Gossypium arboreum]KHG18835.1 hypothetical protein F383_26019 [Gossypium arboreum]